MLTAKEKKVESDRQYRENNREKIKDYSGRHYAANKDRIKKYHKKYRDENAAERAVYAKAYREEHREEDAIKQRARYSENIDCERLRSKRYTEKNKDEISARYKKNRINITDVYVRQAISRRQSFNSEDIPQQLIELKRMHIKLERLIKEVNTKQQ